jgi:hypothetical protein
MSPCLALYLPLDVMYQRANIIGTTIVCLSSSIKHSTYTVGVGLSLFLINSALCHEWT